MSTEDKHIPDVPPQYKPLTDSCVNLIIDEAELLLPIITELGARFICESAKVKVTIEPIANSKGEKIL